MKKRKTRKQEDEKTVACCQKLDFVFSQNPEPRTQNPEPRTQNPEPRTQNPGTMYYKLIAFNARFIHSCPALFYVREELERNLVGCHLEIMQLTINDPYYSTLQSIATGGPQGFFFSVYIWNSSYIKRLVVDLNTILPKTPIILGGPQALSLAEDLSQESIPNCTVIQGEIEGVTAVFYEDLASGNLQPTYKCRKKTTFHSPYRQSDFSGILQKRNIYYESSRGCPFSCTYCLSSADKGVRHLDIAQVFEELTEILKSSPKVVRFVDRTFNDLPDRALTIWQFLIKQSGKTLFHFEMAPDRFTEAMFRFLEGMKPGKFQFEIGVQSTNPETLAAINRKCDFEKLHKNVRRLVKMETIHVHLDLILGLPYESKDTFKQSFVDAFSLSPHYIQMGLLKVLPNTPISKSIDEFGILACGKPPYEILANRWLDKQLMSHLFWFGECVESFYNNRYFRTVWHYLQTINEDIFCFFESLLVLCQQRNFFNLAPTQELLSSLLLEISKKRNDQEFFQELLIYDWLRCGHRFLPGHLDIMVLAEQKKELWKRMPQNLAGGYSYQTRDTFFKQGVFARFSGRLLHLVGINAEEDHGYVCFLAARESTVFKHNKILHIAGYERNPGRNLPC
jgi:hypothetical protein